ncbi:MAG: EamA family transporter [Alphaproteobacteria bacterium]
MDPKIAGLVLLAALMHASWNALVKAKADSLIMMGLVTGFSGVVAVVALPFLPLPAAESWPFIALSVVLHTGYGFFLLKAYSHGDLGQIYPIARGAAPAMVMGFSVLVLGEDLSPGLLAGVAMISAAVISLAFRGGVGSVRDDPRPLFFALGTALFIACYTVTDALGARMAGSAHSYTMWLFALDGVPVAAYALWRRGWPGLRTAQLHWRAGLAGGVLSLGAYWLVIWAMTQGAMAPVAALRETSVIFAAIISVVVLREQFGVWRLAAAGAVALGVIIMRV